MKFLFSIFINICFLPLLASQNSAFLHVTQEVQQARYWTYPYPDLVEQLKKEGKKSILIFSYGSLMDKTSAARSMSQESLATMKPAVAYGIKRLFDRDVPISPNSRYGRPKDPNARGMLNVMVSNQPQDFINGVLVEISLEDIPNIVLREEEYDLMPVVVQDWEKRNSSNPEYYCAYTFHAPQSKPGTNATIFPRPGYYELTRNAALNYGEAFYKIWLETTYLADGVTPIAQWEKKIVASDEQTQLTFD